MNWSMIFPLLVFIGITQLVELGGWLLTRGSIPTWYYALAKPAWTPADGVFGPVWFSLFLLMAVAAFLVFRKAEPEEGRRALVFWGVQLVFNFLWSAFFFTFHSPALAFVEIIILWVLILLTTLRFFRVSIPAGVLMVPYLGWVAFAGALNLAIWRMNP